MRQPDIVDVRRAWVVWLALLALGAMAAAVTPAQFRKRYADVAKGNDAWSKIKAPSGTTYAWNPGSTYVQNPPYFQGIEKAPAEGVEIKDIHAARPLLMAIPPDNLAARIVREENAGLTVAPADIEGFLAAADRLYGSGGLRARLALNARTYAERTFPIENTAARFEEILAR